MPEAESVARTRTRRHGRGYRGAAGAPLVQMCVDQRALGGMGGEGVRQRGR